MKFKYIFSSLIIVAAMFGGSTYAQTPLTDVGVKVDADARIDTRNAPDANVSGSASTEVRGNATSSAARGNANAKGNATSSYARNKKATTTASVQGKLMSESHRSAVATFVKSILAVADREGGIGAEVRAVAQSQNDSASTTAEAIVKVSERSALRTFLIGHDYKNLGVLRSELATTSANIAKLKTLLDGATIPANRVELEAQIKVLETEWAKIEAFVETNESKFSVFGWLTKLFVK